MLFLLYLSILPNRCSLDKPKNLPSKTLKSLKGFKRLYHQTIRAVPIFLLFLIELDRKLLSEVVAGRGGFLCVSVSSG